MSKKFKAAVSSLIAAFAAQGAMSETSYTLEAEGREDLDVIEMTHSDIQHHMRIEALGEVDAKILLRDMFIENGVDLVLADKAAAKTHTFFYWLGNTEIDGSGVANGSAAALKVYESDEAYDAHKAGLCVIKMPDAGAPASEWLHLLQKDKMMNDPDYEEIKFPDNYPKIYDQMFYDYVRFHEQGHCFEADETQAEYMSIQQMSQKYGESHPQELAGFMTYVEDMRSNTSDGEYLGTDIAIREALKVAATGDIYDTPEKVRGAMVSGDTPSFKGYTARLYYKMNGEPG